MLSIKLLCKVIVSFESFVDDALIRELKEMIQKLSAEVKNNRADIDLLLNQPGKLLYLCGSRMKLSYVR